MISALYKESRREIKLFDFSLWEEIKTLCNPPLFFDYVSSRSTFSLNRFSLLTKVFLGKIRLSYLLRRLRRLSFGF